MRLTPAEFSALLKALIDAFPHRARFELMLGLPPVSRNMAQIASESTIDYDYFRVISAADREGWMPDLLAGIKAVDPIDPALVKLIDSFEGVRPPLAIPPHEHLVLDGAPFVNHRDLRLMLQRMTQPFGPKVLQVTGDRASGKSYSWNLISHVGRQNGIRVFLAPSIEATTTAREIVEAVAEFMGLGEPPPLTDAPQDATAAKRLVRWLVAAADRLDQVWWLVFDGFDSPKVDDGVVMLLSALAQSVGMGQPGNLRLFLLAWTRPISGPPPGRCSEQRLSAFAETDVQRYLSDLVTQYRMPRGFDSTDEIVKLVYEGWDAAGDPMDRAVTLTRRLQQVAMAAIEARAGGGP